MFGFTLFERCKIERFRLSALLALDQGVPDRLDFKAALLFALDEVADRFAVVGIVARFDLRSDSRVLLLGQCDGLAHRCHADLHIFDHTIGVV